MHPLLVFACVALFILSFPIAAWASGRRASMAWGWLGPVGWIVEASRGTQERLDDLRELLRPKDAPAPAARPALPAGVIPCPACGTTHRFAAGETKRRCARCNEWVHADGDED